ncbi:Endopeptidase La [Handroanthus impetiginosus]|uniref:Endopeptidase La n=1 Tax=Handroanthus impetiginosus TaxID=429701 RepID=A0A2G9HCQ4_9LAMI|nr:Endopeptidase La [Handroanthus impetiginosus]
MEVFELAGYTPEEKLRIAMRHLIPRVLEQHGLSFDFLQVPEAIIKLVIQRYTREAGVRDLERNLAALARAAAIRVAEQDHAMPLSKGVQWLASPLLDGRLVREGEVEREVIPIGVNNHDISNAFRVSSPFILDEAMLEKVLGPPRYDDREVADQVANVGVSIGLVRTFFGGDVQFVQATALVGNGDLHLTGQLGDVMKEPAQIALTWVRASATELKLVTSEECNLLQGRDIYIHFPAGAVPEDGPSACVTLGTALVSLFSQRRVRADTAMTGEMTLRGLVLPVGGIIDKVLAARRYRIKRVILPERNLRDLAQLPSDVLSSLEIFPANSMEDVLEQAFEGGWPWRQHWEF